MSSKEVAELRSTVRQNVILRLVELRTERGLPIPESVIGDPDVIAALAVIEQRAA